MKNFIALLLCICTYQLSGQVNFVEVKNDLIRVYINSSNVQSVSPNNGPTFDYYAAISPVSTTRATSLWLSGELEDGSQVVSYSLDNVFGQDIHSNIPLGNDGQPIEELSSVFNRLFDIKAGDIASFIDDLSDGTLDDDIPIQLMLWPGKANPHFLDLFGQSLPLDIDFAPFIDVNNDGIYDPETGDYPDIKDADQGVYWLYHFIDNNINSTKAEVHVLARLYNDSDEDISQTVFYDYSIKNKAFDAIKDLSIAMYIDSELGCFTDDYIGFNSECGFAYTYNADDIDGDNCMCPQGINTFCNSIPMMGYSFIKRPKANGEELKYKSFMAYEKSGVTSSPNNPDHVYLNSRGLWKDGTQIALGGNGHNPTANDFTSFCFDGNPKDENSWSMCNGTSIIDDRTMMMSLTSIPSFDKGETLHFTFAAFSFFGSELPCPDISQGITLCEKIKSFNNDVTSNIKEINLQTSIKLFPTIAEPGQTINIELGSSAIDFMNCININGKKIPLKSIGSDGQFAAPIMAGTYFIQCFNDNKLVTTQKIVVTSY